MNEYCLRTGTRTIRVVCIGALVFKEEKEDGEEAFAFQMFPKEAVRNLVFLDESE